MLSTKVCPVVCEKHLVSNFSVVYVTMVYPMIYISEPHKFEFIGKVFLNFHTAMFSDYSGTACCKTLTLYW